MSLLIVGMAGFEPAIPRSQSECLNRTGPHPEIHLGNRWDSNPQQPQPQCGALPIELRLPLA